MTTLAGLPDTVLDVLPGETTSAPLTVRNTGSIVEGYRFSVIGDVASYARVEPAELTLYPDTEQQVQVVFAPPRKSSAVAGELAYAVLVEPIEQPDTAIAPEGRVNVLPFTETTAELTPRTTSGRWFGRSEVAVDNRGNVPVWVVLEAADPEGALKFDPKPIRQEVEPGQAVFHKLAIRNRKVRWRGSPVTHSYRALVRTEGPPNVDTEPVSLDGSMVQSAVIPRNAGRWVAALVALALLAGLAWMYLLRPAVQSAAENAVEEPLEEVKQDLAEAKDQAQAAEEAAEAAASGDPQPEPSESEPEDEPGTRTTVSPLAERLETTVGANNSATDAYQVPDNTTLALTDIVLENPQGDTGRMDVIVSGQVLFTVSLANFRDLDYHFVSPIRVPEGDTVQLSVTCSDPGPRLTGTNSDACRASAVISGKNTLVEEIEEEDEETG